MARISEYKKLTSKIEKIKEKINFKNELLDLDIRLIKENTTSKIQKFIDKENDKLYEIKFSLSNLEEEVNKRLPNAMLKYNIKDYWLRREAIQIWRNNLYSDEATKVLYARFEELNALKTTKEAEVRKKIFESLEKHIISDDQRKTKEAELEKLIKESLERIEGFTKACYEKQDSKINSLESKTKIAIEKLNKDLDELL